MENNTNGASDVRFYWCAGLPAFIRACLWPCQEEIEVLSLIHSAEKTSGMFTDSLDAKQ